MSELRRVSRRIDRDAIRLYAEVSDDFNPIHLDPDFAASTPMRGIIAHGMLSLNLIWQALRASLGDPGARATLEIRFLKPVRENDQITAGGRRLQDGRYEVWAKNQAGETVIAGNASPAI